MTRLIFQAHYQDHVTPLLAAFNDAMAWGGDAPPLPRDPVFIERNAFRGGGSIRLMPSSQLLAWMSLVMAEHERLHSVKDDREAASLRAAESAQPQ